MMNWSKTNQLGINPMAIGIFLIGIGILLILFNVLGIDYGQFAWPFFIIIPGILIFTVALFVEDSIGKFLIVPGSIITVTGIILLYQNTSNHWESWSYTWALVAPTGVGLGYFIYGSIKKQSDMIKTGMQMLIIGLVIFIIGLVFFELVIGISGFGLGRYGWPLLLIGLGVLLVLYGMFFPRKKEKESL